jgi:tripartite-type tricarboxylate transporter receptor subunit TctC
MKATPLALVLCLVSAQAQAQATLAYPSRSIRFIVPQTPGGMVDSVARTVAQHLTERLRQPVVVENRAGANGAIGFEVAAKSAPDGHTLLMCTHSGLVLATATRKTLSYDPLRDFAPITMLFEAPYYLVVHPSVPARNVQELIALARSHPGKLNYGSTGVGSGQHLGMETFKTRAGLDIVHVPYKGAAQAGTDLLSGQVQIMLQGPSFTVPHARSGKIRALAASSAQRTLAMPDLPTVGEAGLPGYEASTWWALCGPAGVPRPIIDRLNRETGAMLNSSAMREKFAASNIELMASTPEELSARVRKEIPMFTKAMRDAGIDPE